MSVAINDSGELSIYNLNQYLGADPEKQLHYSGVYGAPNFSLNQIFFSNSGTNPPQATNNLFSISQLRGKTFGIYTNSFRTVLYNNTYTNAIEGKTDELDPTPSIPIFMGYFGFGDSGILNPLNTGFPLSVTIESLNYQDISVSVKTGDGFSWNTVNLSGVTTTFITTTADAIRIIGGLGNTQDIDVTLTIAPCLKGSGSGGTGRHKIIITLTGQDIRPPIDDPPRDPPGDDILDDSNNPPLIIP